MSAAFEQLDGEARPAAPEPDRSPGADPVVVRVQLVALTLAGLCTILVSLWGAIVPYAGPAFGFDPTGTGPWYWDLSHGVLGLAPGGIGVIAGISMLTSGLGTGARGARAGLFAAGALAVIAGGWIAVGPSAWPAIVPGATAYFPPAAPLADRLGAALGPGLLLVAFGAFTMGWAVRYRPLSALRRTFAPVPASATGPSGEETRPRRSLASWSAERP